MNPMQSVTRKTLASRKKAHTKTDNALWWKVRVTFNTKHAMDDSSLRLAIALRSRFIGVYFARYTPTPDKHYAEFIVKCRTAAGTNSYPVTLVKLIESTLGAIPALSSYVVGVPEMHNGSDAHASAFDAIHALARHFALNGAVGPDEEAAGDIAKLNFALADVQHWMCNMLGIDYLDEMKHHINTLSALVGCMTPPVKKEMSPE